MTTIDIDAIRREVRALDYSRGSPAEAAMWRDDDEDARSSLAIADKHAGTFLSNAGVLQAFGVNDQQSAQLVSDLLG